MMSIREAVTVETRITTTVWFCLCAYLIMEQARDDQRSFHIGLHVKS